MLSLAGAWLISQPAWVEPPVARRNLLNNAAAAAAATVSFGSAAEAITLKSRFDGSYTDANYPCQDCYRNIDADGSGFGMISGKDSPTTDRWETLAQYSGKSIEVKFGDKKMKGTFVNKKGEKYIEWDNGMVWEKMEYKVEVSLNAGFDETPFGERALKKKADLKAAGKAVDPNTGREIVPTAKSLRNAERYDERAQMNADVEAIIRASREE